MTDAKPEPETKRREHEKVREAKSKQSGEEKALRHRHALGRAARTRGG
ncbi:unnamed protein product [Brassica oleracea]|uniref:Uncharacterized protein n=1 Tax=Brassica oleracea TaxID=3712 RepID=A0A3P6EB82_BRAOL|nr:unnamed protein product [Brassica oleracea]